MQISEVLSYHESSQAEHSHVDILGDAFLLQRNPIYRQIKNAALKIGCTYAEATTRYLLMPFQQLDPIVATKTIPYVPSARLLREVEAKRANALTTEDLQIPESYHLHEAAHVIAEHTFAGYRFLIPQEKILKAIICESFANTVDALACAAVDDEMHAFFLRQNCYMYPSKKYVSVTDRLMKGLGRRFTFMYTLIAYMHANFLKGTIPPRLIKELAARYAPDVKFGERQRKDCEALRKVADNLDPQFRTVTTKVYLRLEGYDGELFDLLDFPFMKTFAANPDFLKVTEAMADVVLG